MKTVLSLFSHCKYNERNEKSAQCLIILTVPINAFWAKVRKEPAFVKYSLEFQEEGKETTEGKRASPGIAFSNSI